jgi:hypothetical protein
MFKKLIEENQELEPSCPVCGGAPIFSFDRRVNEWDGYCKRCGVCGLVASTEQEAKRKWIEWHNKKTPVAQKPLFAEIIAQHPGLAEELKNQGEAFELGYQLGFNSQPDPNELAELGWQVIECPICGSSAQAFQNKTGCK